MMRKKTTFGFALTCILVAAAIAFTAGYLIAGSKVDEITQTGNTATTASKYPLLDEVEKVISENYLGEVNQDELVKGVCAGYVDGLGDNSVRYLTAQEYADYNKSTPGETIIYKNCGKGVGYMQFLGFEDSTKQSFTDALTDFSQSGTSKVNMLVFDLRSCSSGKIEVAASLLDLLLPEGETIAGIDKSGNRTTLYTSDQSDLDYDIAVLINGNTSGVAEIFASTLSAYGKAITVGTTTAGSCAKTDAISLSNGDYVLIPNMYYVTKGQQTYSGTGVVPSTVVQLSTEEQKAYDSSTLEISTDPQFIAAVKALGVNDIATVSSDSSSSKASSGSDSDTDSDKDKNSDSDSSSRAASSESSSEITTSDPLDEYWDDDEYWNNLASSDDSNEYSDNGYYDDDGYYYDDYYYDDYDYYY